jgi:hypothetical protein
VLKVFYQARRFGYLTILVRSCELGSFYATSLKESGDALEKGLVSAWISLSYAKEVTEGENRARLGIMLLFSFFLDFYNIY